MSGQLIADPQAQKERWKEHFSRLLNPPPQEANISDLDNIPPQPSFDDLSDSDEAPTRNEIVDALKKLKNHKSPGVDGITNEQLKYGQDQRQHLSAVSAISHNFQFSAQFRTILYSPRNSAYFCFHRIFSHIFPKIALDRIKTKIIVVASWFENGTFSSLKLGHFRFHVLNGIWDVFVPCQLQNLGRFRTSLGMWDVFVLAESGTFLYLPRNVGRFRPC